MELWKCYSLKAVISYKRFVCLVFAASSPLKTPETVLNIWNKVYFCEVYPSQHPCQCVSQGVIDGFRLEIAIASPSFASLFTICELLSSLLISLYFLCIVSRPPFMPNSVTSASQGPANPNKACCISLS